MKSSKIVQVLVLFGILTAAGFMSEKKYRHACYAWAFSTAMMGINSAAILCSKNREEVTIPSD